MGNAINVHCICCLDLHQNVCQINKARKPDAMDANKGVLAPKLENQSHIQLKKKKWLERQSGSMSQTLKEFFTIILGCLGKMFNGVSLGMNPE